MRMFMVSQQEFLFHKMVLDTLIENHFDSSHNTLFSVRRTADVYEWGYNVLWPGLFGNAGPCYTTGVDLVFGSSTSTVQNATSSRMLKVCVDHS